MTLRNGTIVLRELQEVDCHTISNAFAQQGWNKPVSQYQQYLERQTKKEIDILVAKYRGEFAGYLLINWQSDYVPFMHAGIPEIMDFNVLEKFQHIGIGTCLMDEAEKRIGLVSPYAGIRFGVTQDYGAAQILYIKRGYVPDGRGLVINSRSVTQGEVVTISDELVFCLTKKL